jgi:hypothetical protein
MNAKIEMVEYEDAASALASSVFSRNLSSASQRL